MTCKTDLPILCISLQHQWILGLADLTRVVILGLLDLGKCLDAVIFGECTAVTLASSIREELCAIGFDFSIHGAREFSQLFEMRVGFAIALPIRRWRG